MPPHKNQVNFDPDTWTKFSTPHKNQVNSIPYAEINSISITHTEIKSISTAHTKIKSISMPTLKPSHFRPVHKNQVNYDHPLENHINRYPL